MKNVIFKTKYVLMALVMVFIFSCAEDGEVGPQGTSGTDGVDGQDGINGVDGQDGANGEDGKDGADGNNGKNGTNGNANVMSSDWFTATTSFTLTTGFGGIFLLDYIHTAKEITKEIIDTGVVLVYARLKGYGGLWPTDRVSLMPIVLMYDLNPVEIDTWTAMLSVENIRIRFTNSNNTYNSITQPHQFRYVIIPSTGSTSGRIADFSRESLKNDLADVGVDINNYEEVAEYYGL